MGDGPVQRRPQVCHAGAGQDALAGSRVLVVGADGFLGKAVVRLAATIPGAVALGSGVDDEVWRDPRRSAETMRALGPTHVVVAAGRSAGIEANQTIPADLMSDNLRVVASVLPAALEVGVASLVYVASSCVYPREAAQPLRPEALLTGPLELTSLPYSVAKLSGLVLCLACRAQHGVRFVAAIAADAYGPFDDFDPASSHVVAGMIRRMHEARQRGASAFSVWGSGRQVRDLIYVDDLARAVLWVLGRYDGVTPINLSTGTGMTVGALAKEVRSVVGFGGALEFDATKPDGTPVKLLDAAPLAALGFTPTRTLQEGLALTYEWFLDSGSRSRGDGGLQCGS